MKLSQKFDTTFFSETQYRAWVCRDLGEESKGLCEDLTCSLKADEVSVV